MDTSDLRNRIRYRFDNLLARGTWAVLAWLGAVTVGAVLVSSGLLRLFSVDLAGSQDNTWPEDAWQSLLRVLDPGTMASDVGWGRRVLALVVTVFGILIAGTLIGLIANGVEQRVEAMRRGRSTVVEKDHVVILGASERLPEVVEQLALANRGRRMKAIVVLADREPVQLYEEVRAAVEDMHGSILVVRRGDPTRAADLRMVALTEARTVIVLAGDARGDGRVVTAVLAAGGALGAFDRLPIVAEISDPEVAASLNQACGGAVHTVVAAQSIARIAAYSLRAPGLNQVVEQLLEQRGADVYVRATGDLTGMTFGECVLRLADARPIGRLRPDHGVDLNPEPQTTLEEGDRLILIADDVTSAMQPTRLSVPVPSVAWTPRAPSASGPDRVLMLGWSALGSHIVSCLDEIAGPGSSVEVAYDPRLIGPDDISIPPVTTLEVTVRPSNGAAWHGADDIGSPPLTAIVLLAQRAGASAADTDGQTLLRHVLLRRQLDGRSRSQPNVLVELLDADNVHLAHHAGADDSIVSDALTSRLITQLAEQPDRRPILLGLYATGGPSLRLVRAAELGLVGDVGCDDVVGTAYGAGLLAVGWRSGTDVRLNPPLSHRVVLDDADQIVVIG